MGLRRLLWTFNSLLCVVALAAQAQWMPGYEAHGFAGGGPRVAVEFDGKLAIGGNFESVGCTWSPGIVLTDYQNYEALDRGLWCSDPDGSSTNHVAALAVWNGQLIAGGLFGGCGSGSSLINIGRWNGSGWERLGYLTGVVQDLIVFEGELLAVGKFSPSLGGGIARFDGTNWQPMGIKPAGAEAFAIYQGELYCGFSKWNGADWVPFAESNTIGARITALDVVDQGLAIGGTFLSVDGETMRGAALWDGVTLTQFAGGNWTQYDPGFDDCPCAEGVWGFASHDGVTYMLGPHWYYWDWFGLSRLRTAPSGGVWWDSVPEVTWSNFGYFYSGDLLVSGGKLIVLSGHRQGLMDMENAGGLQALVKEAGTWQPLNGGLGVRRTPRLLTSVGATNWVVSDDSELLREFSGDYARESYSYEISALGPSADGVFVAGHINLGGHVPQTLPILREYHADGTDDWICSGYEASQERDAQGNFLSGFGKTIPWYGGYLAEARFGDLWYGDVRGTEGLVFVENACELNMVHATTQVDALVVHQGQPWLSSNGELYRLDGTPDGMLLATLVGTFNQPVTAMVSDGDRLVVGGEFHSVNAQESPHLAIFDGADWVDAPSVDGPVYALARDADGVVIVGGDFDSFGGLAAGNLATMHDDTIGRFLEDPDGAVRSIATTDYGVLIGGDFLHVGGQCSVHVAEWFGDLRTLGLDEDEPQLERILPATVRLHDPSPNPFNPRVTLAFDLPRAGAISLEIFDVAGRRVRSLADRRFEAGSHTLVWNGDDDRGATVAAGVYVAVLHSADRVDQRKLTLVK